MTLAVLRPLAFGEQLDQSFGLYRKLFAPLLIISVVTNAIPSLLSIAGTMAGGQSGTAVMMSLVSVIFSVVGTAVGTAASTFLVSDFLLGRSADVGSTLNRSVPRIMALISCSIMFGFVVGLASLLLLVPGAIAASGLILSFTVVTVENVTGSDSLGRSWELTKGFKWKTFGLLCVFGAVFYGLIVGATVLASALLGGGGLTATATDPAGVQAGVTAFTLVVTVVVSLAKILVYPVLYCMLVTAYYDLRVRKEGFDLELLATTMERPAAQ